MQATWTHTRRLNAPTIFSCHCWGDRSRCDFIQCNLRWCREEVEAPSPSLEPEPEPGYEEAAEAFARVSPRYGRWVGATPFWSMHSQIFGWPRLGGLTAVDVGWRKAVRLD